MKFTFTLLSFFILLSAKSQMIGNQVVTGPAFDYGRDFRMILERTKDKNDSLSYNKLIRRFLEKDSSLTRAETLALMIGFTENPNYKPLESMETEKEIIELNDNGYYEDAVAESRTYLAKHPLSLSTLKECSFAYHQLGKRDSAKYYMALTDMIMEAMIYSGDGKGNKPEIPFFSLGLNDGDYFIPNVGLSVTRKTTENDRSKRMLYVTTAMTDEGTYKTYYFMIQHAKLKMDGDAMAEKTENKKLKKAKARNAAKGKKGKANDGKEEETNIDNTIPADATPEDHTPPVPPEAPVVPENPPVEQPTDSSTNTVTPALQNSVDSTGQTNK